METKIKEIFSSIQGEGPVVGYKQLFIRFCGCNLHCKYCDTDFSKTEQDQIYTPETLYNKLSSEFNLKTFHSISLTGGEPLLNINFLKEFLPAIKPEIKIYLETNATLADELNEIKQYIDIISADIKLKSSTGFDTFDLHKTFFEKAQGIKTFAKVVFDENITNQEIQTCTELASKYKFELILQPKMIKDKISVSSDFCNEILNKFTSIYPDTRLIPQVHKFLNVR